MAANTIGTAIHQRHVAMKSVTPGPTSAPRPWSSRSRTEPLRHATIAMYNCHRRTAMCEMAA
jgi:hypothetical protein